MDDTIRRLAKVLGSTGLEGMGAEARFAVDSADGSRLKVSIDSTHQRFICSLQDTRGVVRSAIDVTPVKKVEEDPSFPGRVVLHVGTLRINLETKPTLAIEIVSES